ncbi:MAG: T9SS type A sorting domain-containing protein, partial [Chitinophagaceae bacterium]
TATNAVSYQWQSWNGSVWSNITGATGATLTLNSVTSSMGSNSYRVLVNGLCTVVTSNQATLYVNPLPTVSISASPLASLLPGQNTSITAVTSPSGGSFVWYKNNLVVPGTGAVLGPLSVDDIGTYKTVYTDPNGCINTSANLVISGQVSDNMWVYPNPNTGQFNVRYYNQTGETATLKVFDYLGHEVFKQILPQGIAYSNTVVNIPKLAAEVYIVKVVTSNGRELAAERIVVYH